MAHEEETLENENEDIPACQIWTLPSKGITGTLYEIILVVNSLLNTTHLYVLIKFLTKIEKNPLKRISRTMGITSHGSKD